MKIIFAILLFLIVILQYHFFCGEEGLKERTNLRQQIATQLQENEEMQNKINFLRNDVSSLEKNSTLLEEKARKELGFIKEGEKFYTYKNNQP